MKIKIKSIQASSNLKSVTRDNMPASHQPYSSNPAAGILLLVGMLGAAAGCMKELTNIGAIEMAQGTWSQFLLLPKACLHTEVGNATGKRQKVLSSVLPGFFDIFLVPFKHNGKGEREFGTQECQYLSVRTLFLSLEKDR